MYKMVDIGEETYKNNNIEVRVDGIGTLQLNENHIEQKLGHKNLPVITNKYDPVYKKHRYELDDKPKKQPNRRFLCSGLALKVIMDCTTDESCNLKRNLGFTFYDVINTKVRTVINSIKDAFEGEDMQNQYSALDYRIDLYFHKHKIAIEVDKLGHADINLVMKLKDKKRQKKNLILCLLELILMKKKLTFSKK